MQRRAGELEDVSLAPSLIAATVPFYAIALTLFIARVTVRISRNKFGLDDYLLSAGMACATGYFIVYLISISYGLGRHIIFLPVPSWLMLSKLSLFVGQFYVWTACFLKLSLACMLLRIQANGRMWRATLIFLITFIILQTVACTIVDYLQCRPIRALWDFEISRKQCFSYIQLRTYLYVTAALYFVQDLIYTFLPIYIIFNIQIPKRQKISICVLMGLGIIASAAIIPKFWSLRTLGDSFDLTWSASRIEMWACIELFLSIIAICIPALKAVIEGSLRKYGLISQSGHSNSGPSANKSGSGPGRKVAEPWHGSSAELTSFNNSAKRQSDGDSKIHAPTMTDSDSVSERRLHL